MVGRGVALPSSSSSFPQVEQRTEGATKERKRWGEDRRTSNVDETSFKKSFLVLFSQFFRFFSAFSLKKEIKKTGFSARNKKKIIKNSPSSRWPLKLKKERKN